MQTERVEGDVLRRESLAIILDNTSPLVSREIDLLRQSVLGKLESIGVRNPTQQLHMAITRPTRETAAQLLGADSPNIPKMTSALWRIRQKIKTSDRRRERRTALLHDNLSARFALEHVLPHLSSSIQNESLSDVLDHLLARIPEEMAPLAADIRQQYRDDEWIREHYAKCSYSGRLANLLLLLNSTIENDDVKLSPLLCHDVQDRTAYTLSLLELHEQQPVWIPAMPNEGFETYIASVVDPVKITNTGVIGFWDSSTLSAVILRDRAQATAEMIMSVASGELPSIDTGVGKHSATHAARTYDTVDRLAHVIELDALCEETKHGLNGMRKNIYGEKHDLADAQRNLAFARERLTHESLLLQAFHQFLSPSNRDREHAAKALTLIEECNAKLTVLACGPDPHLSFQEMRDTFECTPAEQRLENDKCMVLLLLQRYSDAQRPLSANDHAAAFDRLATADTSLLRLAAQRALHAEYGESLESTPFCTVNEKGRLARHPETTDTFAAWMDD